MADRVYLFTGGDSSTVALELALDTDNIQLLVPGSEIGTIEPDDVWHSSPWKDGEDLVRHRVKNREWPMRLRVGNKGSASEADDLADAVTEFNRLMAQARRYHTHGDVDKVSLYIKLDGASVPTYYDVITANPSGLSLMDILHRKRGDAEMSFVLITEPYGYGDEEELENYLVNPHFEEDGDGDGLANGWSKSGIPTTTLDTNIYLCGSQSQKVVTASSGTEGIKATVVLVGSYTWSIVASAWVYVASGDEVTLTMTGDVSGTIDTATYSSATKTDTGASGNTWKKLKVSGTASASDSTITLYIERLTGDASQATTFYVDKCYLQYSTSSLSHPDAWSSNYHCAPFHDGSDTNYYVDVTDIRGDIDSLIKIYIEHGTWGVGPFRYVFYIDNSFVNSTTKRVWEIEDWTTRDPAVSWADNDPDSDASASKSVTLSASSGSISESIEITKGIKGKFKALLRYKKSATADAWSCTLKVQEVSSSSVVKEQTTKTLDANSTNYCVADLGSISLPVSENRLDENTTVTVEISLTRTSGSGTITLDCLYLLPTDGWLVLTDGGTALTGGQMAIQNVEKYPIAYLRDSSAPASVVRGASIVGSYTGFKPNYLNRLTTLWLSGNNGEFELTDWYVRIKYIPRTSFLLGTK